MRALRGGDGERIRFPVDPGEDEARSQSRGAGARDIGLEAIADHERALRAQCRCAGPHHRCRRLARDRGMLARRLLDDPHERAVAWHLPVLLGEGPVEVRRPPLRTGADRAADLREVPPARVRGVALHDRDGVVRRGVDDCEAHRAHLLGERRRADHQHGGARGDGRSEFAGLRVDIPLSGRLPDYTAREAVPLVRRAYQDLLKEHGAENITIIADGSGAALALGSLLAFLPDACPSNVILADPWYDLVASGWQQEHTGRVASYLKEVSHRWAGGQLNNAKVNPGVMDRQEWRQWAGSAFHIFVGGHSQPMRDARRLEKDLKNADVTVNVTRVEGTVYMYHLHRTSEGRRDRRQMIRIAQGQES